MRIQPFSSGKLSGKSQLSAGRRSVAGPGRLGRTEPHPVLKEPAPRCPNSSPSIGFGGEPQRPGHGAPGGAEDHRGGLRILANFRSPLPQMPTAHAPIPRQRSGRVRRHPHNPAVWSPAGRQPPDVDTSQVGLASRTRFRRRTGPSAAWPALGIPLCTRAGTACCPGGEACCA